MIMAPDNLSLGGKKALITGSGRENGIGAAIARGFARNGAAVALHYVSEGSKLPAEKLAANITGEFGVKTTVVSGSVNDYRITQDIVSQALKGLGTDHIDILGKSQCGSLALGSTTSFAHSILRPGLCMRRYLVTPFRSQ